MTACCVGVVTLWYSQEGYDASVVGGDASRHSWSCIVFVRTRMDAFVVTSLLQNMPSVAWMRAGMLLGGGSEIKALDITPEVRHTGRT